MFRTLVWKEWKQAQTLTLVGAALGLLLPLFLWFFAGTEGDNQSLRAYTVRDVFFTLTPGLCALGLWPFWALMSAVQSFAGDLDSGTARFLLDRPVPRTRIWFARLMTSTGNLLAVVGASVTGWVLFAYTLGGFTTGELADSVIDQLTLGLVAALLAFALSGGVLSASFGARSFAGVLLGAFFGAIFPAVFLLLASFFYFFFFEFAAAGCIVLPLLLLGASWLMLCRGEPAGKGRWLRGFGVLASVCVILMMGVLILRPLIVRAACRDLSAPSYGAQQDHFGKSSFLHSAATWKAGWLVDPASGERVRFLPPIVSDVAYSLDGRKVAVMTDAGVFGSPRIELLLADGSATGESVDLPGESMYQFLDLCWLGERLFWMDLHGALYEADFERGQNRLLFDFPESARFIISSNHQQVYCARVHRPRPAGQVQPELALYRVNLGTATLTPEPVAVFLASLWDLDTKISPTGRYLFSRTMADDDLLRDTLSVIDLETGKHTVIASTQGYSRQLWLPGDQLLWTSNSQKHANEPGNQQSLHLWQPGEEVHDIRTWETNLFLSPKAEPVGNHLLVTSHRREDDRTSSLVAMEIYDAQAGTWQTLPATLDGTPIQGAIWAGKGVVMVDTEDQAFLIKLDEPEILIPL